MIRIAAALSLLALAACASPSTPADVAAANARADEGAQVYQQLRLQEVEQQMQPDNERLTYGYAVVNCGLRSEQWLDVLRNVYATDYQAELQQNPLTPDQVATAKAYADSHVSNPTPPPYICQRLSTDDSLVDLDRAVGTESLLLSYQKKKTG